MADIKVQKVEKTEDRGLPIFKQADEMLGRIQRRAFEMFAGRGFAPGHELEDWVSAERELCWPATELTEEDKNYVLKVALPGFEPDQVSVTATPRELIVQACAKSERREEPAKKERKLLWSEFRSNEVYRRIELAEPIDVAKVSATLADGLLKIVAEKAVTKVVTIPIAAAA
ncbi:MAG: Hsp20/alpha crystallin family protein [Steroidobacteraceae bacterium]